MTTLEAACTACATPREVGGSPLGIRTGVWKLVELILIHQNLLVINRADIGLPRGLSKLCFLVHRQSHNDSFAVTFPADLVNDGGFPRGAAPPLRLDGHHEHPVAPEGVLSVLRLEC